MKRIVSLLLLLTVMLTACGKGAAPAQSTDPTGETVYGSGAPDVVGVCLPNNTDPHWQELAAALEEFLSQAGLSANVEYAGDDVSLQVSQVEAMVRQQVGCLVIAAIDSLPLNDVLLQAKRAGIPVIAYDRQLMLTDAVTAYVGFDSTQTGLSIADYIVAARQLETAQAESRSYTVEFFMGAGEDPNAQFIYEGIWNRLQPFLESGVLVCRTGRTAFEDVCVRDAGAAQDRCYGYLEAYYPEDVPDILIAATDEMAGAMWEALDASGRLPAESGPLITGLGATPEGVKQILAGKQSVTAYSDRSEQVKKCLTAVQTVMAGKSLAYLSTIYHNGLVFVPAFFATTTLVDGENYQEILVDGGVYTQEQLN